MKYVCIFLLAILFTIIALISYPIIVIGRFIWDFKFEPVSNTVFDYYCVEDDNMTKGLFPLFSPKYRKLAYHKSFFHYIWYHPVKDNIE